MAMPKTPTMMIVPMMNANEYLLGGLIFMDGGYIRNF
jgi:hypothetical protein